MKLQALLRFLSLSLLCFFGCATPQMTHSPQIPVFYVSPNGNDLWSGALATPNRSQTDGPFASLQRARDAVREIRQEKHYKQQAFVFLRGGVYRLEQPLEFDASDQNTQYAPWKDETVILRGGREISGFQPVSKIPQSLRHPSISRWEPSTLNKIVYCDLKAQGITDYGKLTPRGFGRSDSAAALELFYEEQPMTLAQFPNDGWMKIADVPEGKDGGLFTYNGNRPSRWKEEEDIWTHGYWTHDWADSYVKVKKIDIAAKRILTQEPHGVYGYKKGQRFRILNVLAELDSPGEWYVDRQTGFLYFWPPHPIGKAQPIVSLLEKPLLRIQNSRSITFSGTDKKNLIFECTRGPGIIITGGSYNHIQQAVIRNTGNQAITIRDGHHHTVSDCDIYNTGNGGISLSGGDRKTLTPAGHTAENNHIHHFSRWSRTYNPAIGIGGVGNRAAHNHIHDAPHAGIIFGGNNHIIEYNEIDHICQDTGDVGAIYIGRNWTTRGHIVRYNFFHHLLGPYTYGAMAVYLDDAASGVTIYGNVFYKASHAVFIGGGRDNIVENNIFVECQPSVHIDARGLTWANKYIQPGGGWHMYQKLNETDYKNPPYSSHYPALVNILNEKPYYPLGNVVKRNISVDGKWLELQNVKKEWVTLEDNFVDQDPLFVDRENMNFQLRDNAPAYQNGFQRIPFENIGLK